MICHSKMPPPKTRADAFPEAAVTASSSAPTFRARSGEGEVTVQGSALACFFPGCALELDHDGDHIPKLRCVQRFRADLISVDPGTCELGDNCDEIAIALYADPNGHAYNACQDCEKVLIERGESALLKGWRA